MTTMSSTQVSEIIRLDIGTRTYSFTILFILYGYKIRTFSSVIKILCQTLLREIRILTHLNNEEAFGCLSLYILVVASNIFCLI